MTARPSALLLFALSFGAAFFLYAGRLHGLPQPPQSATTTTITTTASTSGGAAATTTTTIAETAPAIQHVFLILMENHNWSSIAGNVREAPFLNSLLSDPNVAYATNYIGATHPSEPNYLVLEAGDTFGIRNDRDPKDNGQATHDHLVSLLDRAKAPRSWRSYQEHIEFHPCPIGNHGAYAVRHNPVMYFTDVTRDPKYCREHVVPMSQLSFDLRREADTPAYAFITPDIYNDMHSERRVILGMRKTTIQQGDDWLKDAIRMIRKSDAYAHGLVIVTWDESEGSRQPPIGFIMISPFVKHEAIKTQYDHYNAFSTLEVLFGVGPVGNARARRAAPMRDFFKANVLPR